ncbi:hypothetical protein KIPB_008426 [Kipferlia bialata]|uniref:Uncharacterized protein n=1 Tax=Kipferlia bialata TaxID=797122 RepID=A0A9K3D0L0_9EUKA|nr:hypothetical protein KIPB_008426 [Kipferlia bialata]|eukprot:g8426.t1
MVSDKWNLHNRELPLIPVLSVHQAESSIEQGQSAIESDWDAPPTYSEQDQLLLHGSATKLPTLGMAFDLSTISLPPTAYPLSAERVPSGHPTASDSAPPVAKRVPLPASTATGDSVLTAVGQERASRCVAAETVEGDSLPSHKWMADVISNSDAGSSTVGEDPSTISPRPTVSPLPAGRVPSVHPSTSDAHQSVRESAERESPVREMAEEVPTRSASPPTTTAAAPTPSRTGDTSPESAVCMSASMQVDDEVDVGGTSAPDVEYVADAASPEWERGLAEVEPVSRSVSVSVSGSVSVSVSVSGRVVHTPPRAILGTGKRIRSPSVRRSASAESDSTRHQEGYDMQPSTPESEAQDAEPLPVPQAVIQPVIQPVLLTGSDRGVGSPDGRVSVSVSPMDRVRSPSSPSVDVSVSVSGAHTQGSSLPSSSPRWYPVVSPRVLRGLEVPSMPPYPMKPALFPSTYTLPTQFDAVCPSGLGASIDGSSSAPPVSALPLMSMSRPSGKCLEGGYPSTSVSAGPASCVGYLPYSTLATDVPLPSIPTPPRERERERERELEPVGVCGSASGPKSQTDTVYTKETGTETEGVDAGVGPTGLNLSLVCGPPLPGPLVLTKTSLIKTVQHLPLAHSFAAELQRAVSDYYDKLREAGPTFELDATFEKRLINLEAQADDILWELRRAKRHRRLQQERSTPRRSFKR